jgi:hypothetical protein
MEVHVFDLLSLSIGSVAPEYQEELITIRLAPVVLMAPVVILMLSVEPAITEAIKLYAIVIYAYHNA